MEPTPRSPDANAPNDAVESWHHEMQSVFLYRSLAEVEPERPKREMFVELARAAEEQAELWAAQAAARGRPVPTFVPTLRARIVARLARRFGVRRVRPMLAAMKVRGLSAYGPEPTEHPMPTSIEEVGQRHRAGAGALNLRAAVFGVNDGLVSNASLVLGFAGAAADEHTVLLAGCAGLLAGAFSMAAGEYVSVQSQREMFESQIAAERAELALYPEEEAAELALIYGARGLTKDEARRVAAILTADPERALDTLAREELGLDPDGLDSAVGAAASSFLAFAVGAVLPLAPFLALPASRALPTAVAVTAVSLFAIGAATSLFTGKGALWGGLRMLLIGGAAGALTYLIGSLFGVSVG